MAEEADGLPPSEASAFELTTEIKMGVRRNQPFLKDMALTTGLTVDQVRYRGKKPAYQEFLARYKRVQVLIGSLPHVPEKAFLPLSQIMTRSQRVAAEHRGENHKISAWESLQPRDQPGPSRGTHDVLTAQVGS